MDGLLWGGPQTGPFFCRLTRSVGGGGGGVQGTRPHTPTAPGWWVPGSRTGPRASEGHANYRKTRSSKMWEIYIFHKSALCRVSCFTPEFFCTLILHPFVFFYFLGCHAHCWKWFSFSTKKFKNTSLKGNLMNDSVVVQLHRFTSVLSQCLHTGEAPGVKKKRVHLLDLIKL